MMKKLFQTANLLILTLAVYCMVDFFYRFVEIKRSDFNPSGTPAGPPKLEELNKNSPLSSYKMIADRDLFDSIQKGSAENHPPAADIDSLKKTNARLKLLGTISGNDNNSDIARAVIERITLKSQGLYKVGDTVEHAKIIEIYRNSVILDIDGRKEKLMLADTDPGPQTSVEPVHEEAPRLSESEPGQKISLARSDIDGAFKNINKLMNEVKIEPYFQDDKPAGFIVENIAPESVVREMGLKTGDIITRINGRQIKTVDDAMGFYNSLNAGEKLTIEMTRRGRPQTIEYTVTDEILSGQ
jgi:type II secretion system protein C